MTSGVGEATVALSILASPREFSRASVWLESECRLRGIPKDHLHRLDICLNEALANVLNHGGGDAQVIPIELTLTFYPVQGTSLWGMSLTISDGGFPFDPTNHEPRPPPVSLDEAEPGGLGILMMRTSADEIHYRRENDRNLNCFVVRWDPAAA